MGQQIVQQPDGRFAVFSSITNTFIVLDATEEEVVAFRVEEAVERARKVVRRELEAVKAGNPRSVYRQAAMTWSEATEIAARAPSEHDTDD